jgi:hypothetical protein
MWVVVHATSGLALGTLVAAPLWVVVLAALALHVLLDLVPHWDYTRSPRRVLWAALDLSGAIVLTIVVWRGAGLPTQALIAAIVSALPDLDVIQAVLPLRRARTLFPSHWQAFPHGSCAWAPGIVVQAAVVGVSLAAIAVWGN